MKILVLAFLVLSSVAQAKVDDRFVYITAGGLNKTLNAAITAGDLAGGTPVQEAPTGSGTSFALSFTPKSAASVVLSVDGITLRQGTGLDYTISGVNITLSTALVTGQEIWSVYTK